MLQQSQTLTLVDLVDSGCGYVPMQTELHCAPELSVEVQHKLVSPAEDRLQPGWVNHSVHFALGASARMRYLQVQDLARRFI